MGDAFVALHGAFGSWAGTRVVAIGTDPNTGALLPASDNGGPVGALTNFAVGWDTGHLDHGRAVDMGPTDEIIARYLTHFRADKATTSLDVAARSGVPMVASTLSVDPLEAVAGEFGATPGFFQLYTPRNVAVAESLVHRAEAAG